MDFILIFGPPASGKKTIGAELQALTSYSFFHNHLVVDTVLSLFPFGTPSFIKMREQLWRDLISEAVQVKLKGLIFTFNPEQTVSKNYIKNLITDLGNRGCRIFIVRLICPEAIIESRINLPSRHEFNKLTSLELYRELKMKDFFSEEYMPPADLNLDTSIYEPRHSAQIIQKLLITSS